MPESNLNSQTSLLLVTSMDVQFFPEICIQIYILDRCFFYPFSIMHQLLHQNSFNGKTNIRLTKLCFTFHCTHFTVSCSKMRGVNICTNQMATIFNKISTQEFHLVAYIPLAHAVDSFYPQSNQASIKIVQALLKISEASLPPRQIQSTNKSCYAKQMSNNIRQGFSQTQCIRN